MTWANSKEASDDRKHLDHPRKPSLKFADNEQFNEIYGS